MGSELMSVDPQPVCLVCRRPIATPQQWAAFSEGEETDLCWSGAECGADIPVLMERLAEVTRERDAAQARVAELESILHDAPYVCDVENHAPDWFDRLRAALGKEPT